VGSLESPVLRFVVKAGSGWVDHKNELHLWFVSKTGEFTEIVGETLGSVVRSVIAASVRTKAEAGPELVDRMSTAQAALIDQYRRRDEADVDSGVRYAVFPLCSIVVTN